VTACLSVQSEGTVASFAAVLGAGAAELTALPSSGLGVASTLLDWSAAALRHGATALPESAKDEWGCLVSERHFLFVVTVLHLLSTAVHLSWW
jgi:hypothetical protein